MNWQSGRLENLNVPIISIIIIIASKLHKCAHSVNLALLPLSTRYKLILL